MRRTTICRSNAVTLVAFALLGAVRPLAAQDSLAVQRPAVHIVQPGETLWTLAERYFGDAFLWPELYRLNTLVVEDPHWIFPGEELRLIPPDTTVVTAPVLPPPVTDPVRDTAQAVRRPADTVAARPVDTTRVDTVRVDTARVDTAQAVARPTPVTVAAAPPPPPPPSPTESTPTVFMVEKAAPAAARTAAVSRSRYRPVRRGEFYSAGWLTEDERLPWSAVQGAVGQATLRNLREMSSATLNEYVAIRTPEGVTYHVGDSLLLARLDREVRGYGQIVVPAGIARVSTVNGRDVVARVVSQYDRITDRRVALPLEPFRDPGSVIPLPIDNGTRGTVLDIRDRHAVPGQLNVVFVSLGRSDGLVPGDLLEVLDDDPSGNGQPPVQVAVLQIVHVRNRSASGLITRINDLGVTPGATVRLIRKMPS